MFTNRYGFDNTQAFDGLDVLLPRFAFAYDANGSRLGDTQFRGGAGVFTGGDPTVWFSNSFSNDGGIQGFGGSFAAPCTPADLQVVTGRRLHWYSWAVSPPNSKIRRRREMGVLQR